MTGFVWPTDDRIRAITFDVDGATGIVTMSPDGSAVQSVDWDSPSGGGVWSPDGHWLADIDPQASLLEARDVTTGRDMRWPIPVGLGFAAWAPDSHTIALLGPSPDTASNDSAFYTVRLEDGLVTPAGLGSDFSWAPASPPP